MVIVITGPTCVGKTKLSIALAKKLNGEIINADSTQVFKDMNIATAKVTEEEKDGVAHHLFDIRNITEDYTVYDYQIDARNKIDELIKNNKTPILVGGTGLYIKACLYDYHFENSVTNSYDDMSNEELYNKLISIDKNIDIHINNRKRLVNALNYYENTNKLYSDKKKTDKLLYDVIFIGLTTDRDILYDRINKRVDTMLHDGLLDEARKIYDSGIRTKAVLTPIGYKELFPYFDGTKPLDECLDLIKQNSRRYAKKQYTWFNHQMKINWFMTDFNNFDNTIDKVFEYIKKRLD